MLPYQEVLKPYLLQALQQYFHKCFIAGVKLTHFVQNLCDRHF
ncbi:hypothetical protein VCRA2113O20_300030 [Vibrio crassostreae]|nr:hypothetical protein VCRA2113O20_300030 [Vibrio crassostreae]CAK3875689.1 hypothetical protein VCRA2121O71_280012 [Vibrio crassostreae]CAK3875756.1 hypothetical protein VCRA2121O69_280012 [Vibrio crassostreae]